MRYIREDIYECTDEYVVLAGNSVFNTLRCKELAIIGYTRIKGLAVVDKILVIGSGRINILTCSEGIILGMSSSKKPLVLENIFCEKLVIAGIRRPVIVQRVRSAELYVTNSLLGSVDSKKFVVGERVGVRRLSSCEDLVFMDPHVWIEDLLVKPKKITYAYTIPYTRNKA
ncbi:MAG: hypothetical protein ABWW65_06350 [Thermoprotei archaeon]